MTPIEPGALIAVAVILVIVGGIFGALIATRHK